ncbi:hypothetical protein N7492_003926 [Penicillium capsulatum]|uniref:Uncharacterized protein n=1 Tax=Penicillium capsulatum TaxID=69766 RepID=A0A9W9LWJ0_9EURO|nr:hypothetical protein N7492_003926 [Penicillium capsulatum]
MEQGLRGSVHLARSPRVDFQIFENDPDRDDPDIWEIDRNKWLADLCDRRLTIGTHGWILVLVDHVSTPSANLMIGSFKSYRSTAASRTTF